MSDMWDSVSQAWESNAWFVDGHLAEATQLMLDAAGIGEGSDVIELACGPGGAGLAAAERVGPDGSVVFADDAPGMVAAAERRSADLDFTSTVLCGQDELPFEDQSFDAVLIRHGLMFAEDKPSAVAEACRVLRPGGRYAAMTWGLRSENPWLGLTLDAVSEEFGAPFPPPGAPTPFALEDAGVLGQVLEEGGLVDVEVVEVYAPTNFDSLDAWWDLVPQLAGPLAVALDAMDPKVRESIHQRALELGRSAVIDVPAGVAMGGSVLVASGRRP